MILNKEAACDVIEWKYQLNIHFREVDFRSANIGMHEEMPNFISREQL